MMVATHLASRHIFVRKNPITSFLWRALSVTWHGTRLTFAIVHQLLDGWMDGVLFAGAAATPFTRTLTSRCRDGDKYRAIWFRRLCCGRRPEKQDKMRFNRIPHKLVPSSHFAPSSSSRESHGWRIDRTAAAAAAADCHSQRNQDQNFLFLYARIIMSTTYRARDLYRRTCAAAMSHVIFFSLWSKKGKMKIKQPTSRNSFFFLLQTTKFRARIETCDIFHFQHMGGEENSFRIARIE